MPWPQPKPGPWEMSATYRTRKYSTFSERLNRPKMAVFHASAQRQIGVESLLRSYHTYSTPRACSSPNLSAIGRTSRVCQVSVINTQHTYGGGRGPRSYPHIPNLHDLENRPNSVRKSSKQRELVPSFSHQCVGTETAFTFAVRGDIRSALP